VNVTQSQPDPFFVGLDLSLTSTGVAVIPGDQIRVVRVTSKPVPKATSDDTAFRLDGIVDGILAHIPASDATFVAVEGPSFGSSGSAAHVLGGLWWMVRHALRVEGLDVVIVPPSVVKKYATGKGNAPKDQVLAAVIRRYPDVNVTGNDEADALVLAAIRARHTGHPIEETLPVAQASAAEKVTL
jgi:Holliday junction resolvasome RuvABC endonuclease subunit